MRSLVLLSKQNSFTMYVYIVHTWTEELLHHLRVLNRQPCCSHFTTSVQTAPVYLYHRLTTGARRTACQLKSRCSGKWWLPFSVWIIVKLGERGEGVIPPTPSLSEAAPCLWVFQESQISLNLMRGWSAGIQFHLIALPFRMLCA